MKPKLRPNIEKYLITLRYLENLTNKHPEIVRDFLNKSNITNEELGIDPFDLFEIFLTAFELIIDMPAYKFSNLLTADEYKIKSEASLSFITENYLNAKNTGLNSDEKDYIIAGLKTFYSESENNVVPFFNLYSATKYDRIAYSVLASAVSIMALMRILFNIFEELNKARKVPEKETIANETPDETLNDISQVIDAWSLTNEPTHKPEEKKLKFLDGIPESFDDDVILPENKNVPGSSLISSFQNFFKELKEEINLDNKSLSIHYIKTIFDEITELMPNLSVHRRQIIVGYLAMDFGIIKADEHNPTTSSYKTLNSFLNNRIKGIVQAGQKTKPLKEK